jgi:hypothetical protein
MRASHPIKRLGTPHSHERRQRPITSEGGMRTGPARFPRIPAPIARPTLVPGRRFERHFLVNHVCTSFSGPRRGRVASARCGGPDSSVGRWWQRRRRRRRWWPNPRKVRGGWSPHKRIPPVLWNRKPFPVTAERNGRQLHFHICFPESVDLVTDGAFLSA